MLHIIPLAMQKKLDSPGLETLLQAMAFYRQARMSQVGCDPKKIGKVSDDNAWLKIWIKKLACRRARPQRSETLLLSVSARNPFPSSNFSANNHQLLRTRISKHHKNHQQSCKIIQNPWPPWPSSSCTVTVTVVGFLPCLCEASEASANASWRFSWPWACSWAKTWP